MSSLLVGRRWSVYGGSCAWGAVMVAFASLAGGCFVPVPVPSGHESSRPWADKASQDSHWVDVIKDGQTTKKDVRGVLGPHDFEWNDGRVVAYRARLKTGETYLVGVIVGGYTGSVMADKWFDMGSTHILLIEYDDSGCVRRHDRRSLALSASSREIDRLGRTWAADGSAAPKGATP